MVPTDPTQDLEAQPAYRCFRISALPTSPSYSPESAFNVASIYILAGTPKSWVTVVRATARLQGAQALQGFQGNHSAAGKQVRAQKSALRAELARVRTLGEPRGVAAKLRSAQTGLVLADHNFRWNNWLS